MATTDTIQASGLYNEEYDIGYKFGEFPVGPLAQAKTVNGVGSNGKSVSDPFLINNQNAQNLVDNFSHTSVGALKRHKGQSQGELGQNIYSQFQAGVSTFNNLSDGATVHGTGYLDYEDPQFGHNINPSDIQQQFQMASVTPAVDDIPVVKNTYPNFGNGVQYGYEFPNQDTVSNEILQAYQSVIPEATFTGLKKDLMPVFSNLNVAGLVPMPVTQSRGHERRSKFQLPGGFTSLPKEFRMDPREALARDFQVPTGIEQSEEEMKGFLDALGYNPNSADGEMPRLSYTPAPGQKQTATTMLPPNKDFYSYHDIDGSEPLNFGYVGTPSNVMIEN